MKSLTTPDFWKAYAKLSAEMQEKVQKAYRLWQNIKGYRGRTIKHL